MQYVTVCHIVTDTGQHCHTEAHATQNPNPTIITRSHWHYSLRTAPIPFPLLSDPSEDV